MELVEGASLDRQLPADGMPVAKLLDLAWALADALAAAHDKGIVHRDLKPGNVMLTADGRVKVLDFGLAKANEPEASTDNAETIARTSEGVVMGTVPYMSPEQVEGRNVDARSDVFSLGVVLHEAATGSRPFQGDELRGAALVDPARSAAAGWRAPCGFARRVRPPRRAVPRERPRPPNPDREGRAERD